MKQRRLLIVGLFAALALASSAEAALQDENILLPLPADFKLGNHAGDSKTVLSEFVPTNENVDHWSRMITERIGRGIALPDPEAPQTVMLKDWKGACPAGEGRQLSHSTENGYSVSYWSFDCPLNPQTKLGESMVRKIIAGKDAMYDVQFAYRKVATAELQQAAFDYLRTVTVCDTRTQDHPCPSGLTPAQGSKDPAPNPIQAFLHAADVNDFAAMAAVLDRGSSGFLKKISNCYLRRVYSSEQKHELIAAWMCSEGPSRSRVLLADINAVSGNRVSVSIQQNNVNERPAPERTGSAFAD